MLWLKLKLIYVSKRNHGYGTRPVKLSPLGFFFSHIFIQKENAFENVDLGVLSVSRWLDPSNILGVPYFRFGWNERSPGKGGRHCRVHRSCGRGKNELLTPTTPRFEISKLILVTDVHYIFREIAHGWLSLDLTTDESTLVKPLPEPMLTLIYAAIWCYLATVY